MQRCTVMLIPDDNLGWDGLRRALATHPAADGIGEATSAEQALELAAKFTPNVIVAADIIEGESALPLLGELKARVTPDSRIVIIAGRFNRRQLPTLVRTGVVDHLLWRDLSTDTISHLLSVILNLDIVVASRELVDAFVGGTLEQPNVTLTDREQMVLTMLCRGLTHREIAGQLDVGARTVEREVGDLKDKLGAVSEVMLGYRAGRLGRLGDDVTL